MTVKSYFSPIIDYYKNKHVLQKIHQEELNPINREIDNLIGDRMSAIDPGYAINLHENDPLGLHFYVMGELTRNSPEFKECEKQKRVARATYLSARNSLINAKLPNDGNLAQKALRFFEKTFY